MQFWRFSVLQRHGVSLPGGDFVHGVFPSEDQQQQKPLQQQAEKVARIHSSSKREKKQPKASFHHLFSMGFRSYLRHFRDAILELLCPSEAWCFPIWGPAAAAKVSAEAGGFRSYLRHFRGAILRLLRPSEAWCFAPGR